MKLFEETFMKESFDLFDIASKHCMSNCNMAVKLNVKSNENAKGTIGDLHG